MSLSEMVQTKKSGWMDGWMDGWMEPINLMNQLPQLPFFLRQKGKISF
jgi:hypothetical protein